MTERRDRFRELHADGIFVMPNPWDVGSAKLLAAMGFEALATTSAGLAWSLGKLDMQVTRNELVAHVADARSRDAAPAQRRQRALLPRRAGRCRGDGSPARRSRRGRLLDRGLRPRHGSDRAARDRGRARGASRPMPRPLVLTARAENHLHGIDDLDDTIARLVAYRDAGADVVYAPGLRDLAAIGRVVQEVGVPVNVLALPVGPSVSELAAAGVRRVSTGGALARAAYGALLAGAAELRDHGTSGYSEWGAAAEALKGAFGHR